MLDACAFWPELILVAGFLVLSLTRTIFKSTNSQNKNLFLQITALFFLGAWFALITLHKDGSFFFGTLVNDFLSFSFKTLLLSTSTLMLLIALTSQRLRLFFSVERLLFLTLSVLGGLFALSSGDFITLFVALELHILPLYLLVAAQTNTSLSLESSVKYLILGGLASCFLLFGLSFIYGASGLTHFSLLSSWTLQHTDKEPFLILGFAFIIPAFGFKLSLAPFHFWTLDVYEGSSTPVTLFLATCAKIVSAGVVLKFFSTFSPLVHAYFHHALVGFALLSILVGSLCALFQDNLKRLLACSTVTHMGYLLSGILLGGHTGAVVVVFYLAGYILTTFGTFVCLTLHPDKQADSLRISRAHHISEKNIYFSGLLTLFVLALAGLPPFPLFFSKLILLSFLIQSEMWLLVSGLIFGSVVSCYYYLGIVRALYFDHKEARVLGDTPAPS